MLILVMNRDRMDGRAWMRSKSFVLVMYIPSSFTSLFEEQFTIMDHEKSNFDLYILSDHVKNQILTS